MTEKRFLKGFVYAFRGIVKSVKSEMNLRIHIVAMLYVLYFSRFYSFTRTDYAVLFTLFALVISLELVNTAVEHTVDKASPERNRLARLAKDASAGAVLASAIFAVVIGIVMFWDTDIFVTVWSYHTEKIYRIFLLAGSICLALAFVLMDRIRKGNKK